MMAIASVTSLWTEEFLEEVATALEVSLGRVTANDLDSKSAAHWKQAQQWLRTVKQAAEKSPADVGPAAITLPFPLNGEQLRSLQRAVDRAAQTGATQKARSKAQRIVNKARNHAPVSVYARLQQGLKHLRLSSGALATLLAAMCVLSIVELYIFRDDALYHLVFGAGVILSAAAVAVWLGHHWLIRRHSLYVEGIGAPIGS
jgi:hypothetical protein